MSSSSSPEIDYLKNLVSQVRLVIGASRERQTYGYLVCLYSTMPNDS
jgi:hypothetical protein